MFIKSVNHNIKDIFLGDGWDSWVRLDLRTNQIVTSNIPVPEKLRTAIVTKTRNFFKKH